MTHDIIFAGGGTTACVIAGRLAAANPSLKILIIESGKHSQDVPSHVQPCRHRDHTAAGLNSTTVHFHKGKPSSNLNGRAPVVFSGKGVGGGSIVNFMFYVRGAASDYDDWAAFGNSGWSFSDLLPLIKKAENFTAIPSRETHGYSGPIQISDKSTVFDLGDQFLNVAQAYDPARPQVDDPNDFKIANAYSASPSYRYVDPVSGKRCDTASQYLYPTQAENRNLEIMVGKRVKRVIIENGRAMGVEYIIDGAEGGRDVFIAKASKLVVVSAGTFGSPAILERSGIGRASLLKKNNIPVLVDLPGVGENYLDHFGGCSSYHASEDLDTMKDVWSDPKAYKEHLKEWERHGTGKVSLNGIDAMAKVRPTTEELRSAGPELRRRLETFFESRPDKTMSIVLSYAGCPLTRGQQYISVIYLLVHPDIKGSVHVTSGDDVNVPSDFDPNFFSKACDIEQLTLMYKLTRELYRRLPAYRGEVAAHHPKFPPGSAAACRETAGPVPMDAPKIVYSAEDDEAIVDYHRNILYSGQHPLGTCAMKPLEQGGVVDSRLNVHGVEGLKVADLSICPSNVGTATYSTALVIGEKAAVIIAEDLELKL